MYKMLSRFIVTLAFAACVGPAKAGFVAFEASGFFIVPTGVTSVTVLAIGGGGGGANGHQGGGGSGYVDAGVFAVSAGDSIAITVGTGGSGGNECIGCNTIVGLTAGTGSSFGALLSVDGGQVVDGINLSGNDGGSGGGASWNGGTTASTPGCTGGSGGSNGDSCRFAGGIGQGDYTGLFSMFVENLLSAGVGGTGGTGDGIWNGGGGAGGILINGLGPSAGNGGAASSAFGGLGYGAGGGAGGFVADEGSSRYSGGNGADGLVYIEFASAVPAPASMGLFGIALSLMGLSRRTKA